jgi:hypothetical protein
LLSTGSSISLTLHIQSRLKKFEHSPEVRIRASYRFLLLTRSVSNVSQSSVFEAKTGIS